MSVERLGTIAGKAALAGFAMAVLTAAAAPAKAAVVTWDLWIAYDAVKLAKGTERSPTNWGAWATGQWVDSNPFGIGLGTPGTGSVTFEDSGCGDLVCGPVEDPSFQINFAFEGTALTFSTNDDHRYNGSSYVNEATLGRGPAVKFFGPAVQGVDFNVPFAHNSSVDNWALSLEPGVVELYDLSGGGAWPHWTVLRGTLCHNGYGEPGEDSVCYRGSDDDPVLTPVPAALPLFASGLVAMGLGAWRRRRNG